MAHSSVVYTVRELNERLQELICGEPWLGSLGVEGEITGLGRDKRGHMYFSLKDSGGVLSAVMFSGSQRYGLGFEPSNGDKVHAFGHIDVYVRDGRYQLYVDRLVRVGDGEVNAKLERLKAKLSSMGLFSQEYKKEIPAYPRRIGVVTAGARAAISDIRAVAARRDPYAQLYCYPAAVQGRYAAPDISRGIEVLDEMGLDLIIVGRGGGSAEDLWAFNEEQVAWAIFNAQTPVISAAGHEIDYTIADLVADRRESNPSTAVMHALPVVSETVADFDGIYERLTAILEGRFDGMKRMLEGYDRQLRLLDPKGRLRRQQEKLDSLGDSMRQALELKYEYTGHRLEVLTERLHGISPTAKLVGGFGYIMCGTEAVRSVHDVSRGDTLELTLHDGRIKAVVSETADTEV